jgi:hypothetical protein
MPRSKNSLLKNLFPTFQLYFEIVLFAKESTGEIWVGSMNKATGPACPHDLAFRFLRKANLYNPVPAKIYIIEN